MARVVVEGADIVVRLSWWEKAMARHRDIRVPVTALRLPRVEPDWWRALRGERGRGTWIPGRLYAGVRPLQEGRDFVLIREGRPVLCVELRRGSPYSRLAVFVPDPEETRGALVPLAPRDRLGVK
ncbi:hypothetical protein ACFYW1_21610 [Streptomyces sp. NPDC002669]|uniref:hypothetical protein n=1 Tax=Streptomyces sp. NPDC002669 TaxID=3364658 RepID=UPI0036B2332C